MSAERPASAATCPKYGGKVCRPEAGALCECYPGKKPSAATGRSVAVEVKATEMDVFKQAVALLNDAYEALSGARSEGWDLFSGPIREEVCGVMDAIRSWGCD